MEMCARCKKRPATVYIMKLENGVQKQEGLCLVCAKELGIKPVNDIMSKMGISEEELENMEKLIKEFRKLKPEPHILIFQHIPGSNQDGFGKSYSCGQTSWQYRKNLDFYNRALLKKSKDLKFTIVPMYINIDTEHKEHVVRRLSLM